MGSKQSNGRILLTELELRRFYSKCVVDLETGCWEWTAGHNPDGYGQFSLQVDGVHATRRAHVVSYNHFVDTIPPDHVLGHKREGLPACKCTFWEHVRPITSAQNAQETHGTNAGICTKGHDVEKWGRTSRSGNCKVCERIRHAARKRQTVCTDCGYAIYNCKC